MSESDRKTASVGNVDYRACIYPVPYVPLRISDEQPLDVGARLLLKRIRAEWPTERIQFQTFTDGYTNKLIACSVSPDDVILVRVYGKQSDLLIDRDHEIQALVILHGFWCAAPIYCRFENGIAYGFVPGVMVNPDLARQPSVQRLIAQKLARLHSVDVASAAAKLGDNVKIDSEPSLYKALYDFVDYGPFNSSDPQKQAIVADFPLNREQLMKEIHVLHDVLPKLGSPVVFCHNDLLLQNIIYDKNAQEVNFIDFEFAAYNYQAHDIAMHFCDYGGFGEQDFSQYPDREYQLRWLRSFLEFYYEETGRSALTVMDVDVERLYVQVNKFTLGVCMFNAVWGLVQIQHSDLDFSFSQFVRRWLEQYCTWKERFLSLEMP